MGLFVALPAVWIFNDLISKLETLTVEMDNSAAELSDYLTKEAAQEACWETGVSPSSRRGRPACLP